MKSQIMLSGIAALLVSVAGANALEYRPFVGATMGLQGSVYSGVAKDLERTAGIDLPTDFFAFGIEGGVRAGGYNQIYNGGLTLNATKTTYSDAEDKLTHARDARIDMFNIGVTYDNFVRISGDKEARIDLVLGAGLGTMAYHVKPNIGDSETKWSIAPELKAGLDFELTHNITLSVLGSATIPTRSHYYIDMSYVVGGAVKYMF